MKTVHLIGVGGTAMVSLAALFLEKGWKVRGSDANVYPPVSDELKRLKVSVFEGFKPENLEPRPDLVIVGNVVSRGNPEVEALLKTDIPYTSMAQGLAEYFLGGRRPMIVAGTHGKTTTTSLLAWILDVAGESPGFFVGGIPKNFGCGSRAGSGEPFVLEGDEYDTAFFEKTPKFIHYKPYDALVTSIEFDHADIYRDLAHVVEQFEKLVALVPTEGTLAAWGDHPTVKKVCSGRTNGTVRFYGFDASNEWRAGDVETTSTGTRFKVVREGKEFMTVDSPMLGRHNALNTLGAMVLASAIGVDSKTMANAIRLFQGVKRRQEFVGEEKGIRIYDDFAHHPTAIEETLRSFVPMAKARKGRLWAVFEPRSNTVRRRVFQDVLPASFKEADEVLLAPVYQKKDALQDRDLLQPAEVADAIRGLGGKATAIASHDDILRTLRSQCAEGDVVLFMSNGSFGGLPARLRDQFQSSS